jgi:hypothetical protein
MTVREAREIFGRVRRERDEALALARELSDALLCVRPLGGSELFIQRCGGFYADPERFKRAIAALQSDVIDAYRQLAIANKARRDTAHTEPSDVR